jgi:hypothetical protein
MFSTLRSNKAYGYFTTSLARTNIGAYYMITNLNGRVILADKRTCPSGQTHYHGDEIEVINGHKQQKFEKGLQKLYE